MPKFLLSLFCLLASVAADARPSLPELTYARVGDRRPVLKTKFFNVFVSNHHPGADAAPEAPGEGVAHSRYRSDDKVDWAPTERALEALQTEVEPRLERLLRKLEKPTEWRALFPVDVVITLGVSPLHASFNGALSIGDDVGAANMVGWTNIFAHETGHAMAEKLKMNNDLYQEFWADFFAWAVFDFDPRISPGFADDARHTLEEMLKIEDDTTREIAAIQLSLIEGESVRFLVGPYDLRRMYRLPERYLFAVTINRLLQAIAGPENPERLAVTALNLLRAKGPGLSVDVIEFARLFEPAFGRERVAAALAAGGLTSAGAPQPPLLSNASLREGRDSLAIEIAAPKGTRPLVGIFSGTTLLYTLAPTPDAPASLEIKKRKGCKSDDLNKSIALTEPMRIEAALLGVDGAYLRESFPIDLRRLRARPLDRGDCWTAKATGG